MTLKEGKTGQVLRIEKLGESPLKQRLMTMGLIPGTRIKILRSAPLGDPIAIGIRSYSLSMRRDDAALIDVTLVEEKEA
ncbi:FeoA family protein [Selenomonas sp. TAMA-11512]|uniref:FeoA family protein n=1 Tax=Selenomonas sp. TAMA-11512 TaxID=3095337 RepID=UPI00308EB8C1|nr:FeoA family protein [Selenomonas sp. TAMA-11512]